MNKEIKLQKLMQKWRDLNQEMFEKALLLFEENPALRSEDLFKNDELRRKAVELKKVLNEIEKLLEQRK